MAQRAGLLPYPVPTVLIGGTNGKGSCVALMEAALLQAGHRVGAYTSPHLLRFNERIRINGVPVPDACLISAFSQIEKARQSVELTYFEFATLAAMVIFQEQVEIALMEVGLGGRLDAVNICDPFVSLVTSVDLDHQTMLGRNREAIGREKAGIFRTGVPAICGDPEPPHSVTGCEADPDPLWLIERDFSARRLITGQWEWSAGTIRLGPLPPLSLRGRHQLRNAATAIAGAQHLPRGFQPNQEDWCVALPKVELPGRAQCLPGPIPIWLDVAHNPQAAVELAEALREAPIPGQTLAVFGSMRDKCAGKVASAMAEQVDQWYPCAVSGARGLTIEELEHQFSELEIAIDRPFPDPSHALEAAWAAAESGDRIVTFGSFMVVATALQQFASESTGNRFQLDAT